MPATARHTARVERRRAAVVRLEERRVVGVDDEDAHRVRTLPASLVVRLRQWNSHPSGASSPSDQASFIGLGDARRPRARTRIGAFGQVLLIAAVLGSTIRADLYFIASIVPLTIGNVVGEALAAAVLPRRAAGRDAGGDATVLGWVLDRRPRSRRADRRLPARWWPIFVPRTTPGRERPACSPGSPSRRSAVFFGLSRLLRGAAPSLRAIRLAGPSGRRRDDRRSHPHPRGRGRSAAASSGSVSRSRPATASRCSCS